MTYSQRCNPKRIGEILIEASLLSASQVQVALYDQQQYTHMRIGEILVSRGWINQQTVDFFGSHWRSLCAQVPQSRNALGQYLCEAGLVDQKGIETIIAEQYRNGYRFGANAVLLGFIRQQTLDYFLENLFPDKKNDSFDVLLNRQNALESSYPRGFASKSQNTQNAPFELNPKKQGKDPAKDYQSLEDDINWVG